MKVWLLIKVDQSLNFKCHVNPQSRVYALCDSKNGYCLNFSIDPGKTIKKGNDYLYNLVLNLMEPYLNNLHILYTDSYYSSPKLFEKLKEEKTGATGMMKKIEKDYQMNLQRQK